MKISKGRLNQRITIQSSVPDEDIHGISEDGWVDLKTVWCSMNNLYGKEYWSAKEYNAENTVEFVVRYNAYKDLTVKNRIKYGDRIFNIFSVDNVLYDDEVLKIKAKEVN